MAGNPYAARRWREGGSEGAYAEMDPDVRPDGPPAADAYPEGASGPAVLAWVGDSPQRAAVALAAERRRPEPRRTVVAPLERLAGT